MTMTRKHFKAIAAAVAQLAREEAMDAKSHAKLANTFAAICAGANPNFDRARFLAACGVRDA